MRRLFAIGRDLIGNLPPMPGVFPNMPALIVRIADDGVRELLWRPGAYPEARALQRPLPDAAMAIVASGEKDDRHDAGSSQACAPQPGLF